MALIKCPECGKEVSDRAKKCPACGAILIEEVEVKEVYICEECGNEIPEGVDTCPNCGCPIVRGVAEVSIQGDTGAKSSKKTLKKLFIGLVAIIAVISIILVVNHQKKVAEQEAAQKAIEESIARYGDNLSTISFTMLLGASDAEEAGGLLHDVWANTIYKESDSKTDKYTKKNSYSFYDDFNDAIANLYADSDYCNKLSAIQNNQEGVKGLMKELTNPPDEYKDAYDSLKDYYDAYLELTNLVLNPSGSLQTFTSNFNDADSKVAKYYEKMKLYIEE